ncbi:MAG: MFS transporter [Deltaproteobacteria bacterium]|nr:MFS transporter [Deltaproteobacteria bacterium]
MTNSAPAPPAAEAAAARPPLWTREFTCLLCIIFCSFLNMAVFFQFNSYLLGLGLGEETSGLLIGVFSLVAVLMRPVISPLMEPHNAGRWILFSSLGCIASLALYNFFTGAAALMAVRIVHGAVYTVLGVAATARLVAAIPPSRSGEAFGMMAVITLLPFAVVPPVAIWLFRVWGGFLPVLNLAGLFLLVNLPLLALTGSPGGAARPAGAKRIHLGELKENLTDRRVSGLLGVSLLAYTAFGGVFFFAEGLGKSVGVANVGWFFTANTLAEILVRVVLGSWFDRTNKKAALGGALGFLTLCFAALGTLAWWLPAVGGVSPLTVFLGLGVLLGLGWGVAMPLLNALLFDSSEPRFRPLNINLGLEAFQAGLFFGPLVGGLILAGASYGAVFLASAGCSLAGAALLPLVFRRRA